MFDIVALGEALIDFAPMGKNAMGCPCFSQNPGGAPANVLAMASKLGARTGFVGKVGNDAFGHFLLKTMDEAGIDTGGVVISSDNPTTLAFVSLSDSGDRSFSFYRNKTADVMLEKEEIKSGILDNARVFHFGSVSMTAEPSRSATFYAVGKARTSGAIISYDPNYRPLLWKSEKEAREVMLKGVPFAHILKVSDEEMLFLTGTKDEEEGTLILADMGPEIVIVTKGADGAFLRMGEYTESFCTIKVDAVDTTGAGDTFLGSFLYSLILKNGIKTAKQIKKITIEKLREAVIFANIAGSLSTKHKGAIPSMPSPDDILEVLNGGE